MVIVMSWMQGRWRHQYLIGATCTNSYNSFRPPGYISPISSRDLCQTTSIPSARPFLFSQPKPLAKLSPLSFTYAHKYPFQNHPHQMNFLSPYCISNTTNHLSSLSLATGRSDNLSSSYINLAVTTGPPQPTLLNVSPGYNTSNYGSVSP